MTTMEPFTETDTDDQADMFEAIEDQIAEEMLRQEAEDEALAADIFPPYEDEFFHIEEPALRQDEEV
jgi:hypothetical protein